VHPTGIQGGHSPVTVRTFTVARNPDPNSRLPYLIRVPLANGPLIFKTGAPWPRTAKVYCHRADGWPADAELLEQIPVRSCVRRGAAIDLVLDRPREHRSQLVFTTVQGRGTIFWQSARTAAKPAPASACRAAAPPATPPTAWRSWSTPASATHTGSRASRLVPPARAPLRWRR
jgi:hypothetical protein